MRFTNTTQQNSFVTTYENRKNNGLFLSVCSLLIALCFLPVVGLAQTTEAIQGKFRRTPLTKVANKYIVIFKDELKADKVEDTAMQLAKEHNGTVKGTLKHLIKGFIIEASESNAISISADSRIDHIEEVGSFEVKWEGKGQDIASPEIASPAFGWAIDRVDQRNLSDPLSNGYYNYDNTGSGVHVYVVDSGIKANHPEFQGRVIVSRDADFAGDSISGGLTPGYDGTGHGTAVAAQVGGKSLGVAKLVSLHSVRVFNQLGQGDIGKIMLALDWVKNDILSKRLLLGGADKYPAIVNMSLEINSPPTTQTTLTAMIQGLLLNNITVVAAAGNGIPNGGVWTGQNVVNVTPAGIKEIITVAATSPNDSFAANFSNFGKDVDILAPGTFVIYPYHLGDSYIGGSINGPFDGTSFSAPLVAGAAALYLQSNPKASPQSVRNALVTNATLNKITNIPIEVTPSGSSATTPNRLLFTNFRILAVRNGASYGQEVAPDSLATVFGSELNPDSFLTLSWGAEGFESFLTLL